MRGSIFSSVQDDSEQAKDTRSPYGKCQEPCWLDDQMACLFLHWKSLLACIAWYNVPPAIYSMHNMKPSGQTVQPRNLATYFVLACSRRAISCSISLSLDLPLLPLASLMAASSPWTRPHRTTPKSSLHATRLATLQIFEGLPHSLA